jgi:hypothetical protein
MLNFDPLDNKPRYSGQEIAALVAELQSRIDRHAQWRMNWRNLALIQGELLNVLNSDLQRQPKVVQASCAECGIVSTPDSMTALYCLDCIGHLDDETRKALAQGGPRAFNPSGDGSTPSERAK